MSLYGFFLYLQKYTADQTLVQRYLVAKTDRDALKGVAFGAILCVPAWAAFMLVGTLLWAYYQLSGETLPAQLHDAAGKIMPTKSFRFSWRQKFPSASQDCSWPRCYPPPCPPCRPIELSRRRRRGRLLPQAAPKCIRPPAAHRGKIIVAVCGPLTIGIAALIAWKSDRSLSLYYAVSSIVAAGLAGIFLLAILSRRANRQGLWTGILAALDIHSVGDVDLRQISNDFDSACGISPGRK